MGQKNGKHASRAPEKTNTDPWQQLIRRLRQEESLYARDEALVRASSIVARHIAAIQQALEQSKAGDFVTLTQAAALCGYSPTHLGRLVRDREIPNYGRKNAPRVKVSDLPIKPGHLRRNGVEPNIEGTSKGQIVRSAVESERRP